MPCARRAPQARRALDLARHGADGSGDATWEGEQQDDEHGAEHERTELRSGAARSRRVPVVVVDSRLPQNLTEQTDSDVGLMWIWDPHGACAEAHETVEQKRAIGNVVVAIPQ